MAKVNKTIGQIWNFQHTGPRTSLVTICKAFIKPHSDYAYAKPKLLMILSGGEWNQFNTTQF